MTGIIDRIKQRREAFRERKRTWDVRGPADERLTLLSDIVRELRIRDLLRLQVAHGEASGKNAGSYYKVTFPGGTINNANVVAVGEVRGGRISRKDIPRISDIPRVSRDDFNSDYYCNLVADGARDRAKDMSPPWPLDILWGWFCDTLVYGIFWAGWWASGWILNVLWDSFIQPQIDKVFDGIQSQTDEIRDRVNRRLDDLYEMWGLPKNKSLTPVHVRNVTDAGFEWLSLGNMTIHWIAVGER